MERRVLCACANGQMIANRTRGPTIMNQTHVRAIDRGCLLANIVIRAISCQYWTSYIGSGVRCIFIGDDETNKICWAEKVNTIAYTLQ